MKVETEYTWWLDVKGKSDNVTMSIGGRAKHRCCITVCSTTLQKTNYVPFLCVHALQNSLNAWGL